MKEISREWIKENILNQFDKVLLPDLIMLEEVIYAKDSQEDIKSFLRSCQNEDGGFKAWLEPDIQSDVSTMIATSVALSIYNYIGEIDKDISVNVAKYLNNKFNKKESRWNIVSNDLKDAPRAFWWNSEIEPTFGYVNPSASILAYVEALEIEVDTEIKEVLHSNISKLTQMNEIHDYACLEIYYALRCEDIPEFILEGAKQLIERDSSKWNTYAARPLDVITSTMHPLYESFKEDVDTNLDYIIDELITNKLINPNWTWNQYEEHFENAKKMWQQRLTYEAIKKLHKFGRLK